MDADGTTRPEEAAHEWPEGEAPMRCYEHVVARMMGKILEERDGCAQLVNGGALSQAGMARLPELEEWLRLGAVYPARAKAVERSGASLAM